jgi:predicted Zn-dependent protease
MTAELSKVVDFAQKLGAEFADARLERHRLKRINVVNGNVQSFTSSTRFGVAVRVKLGSAWGLAATSLPSLDSWQNAVRKAFKMVKTASVYSRSRIEIPQDKSG